MLRRAALLILAIATLGALSCTDSKLSSGSSTLALSDGDLYLTSASKIRVIQKTDAGLIPITSLSYDINQAQLPVTVYNGAAGDRRNSATPQPMDLYLRAYVPDFAGGTGDFFFETLVLHSEYEISNVTTALTWLLRSGFNRSDFKISKDLWDATRKGIEVFCADCRKKTSTEVLNLAMSNATFLGRLEGALQEMNPGFNLKWIGFSSTVPILAASDPPLGAENTVSLTAKEADTVSLFLLYVNPFDSTKRISVDRWSQIFNTAETASQTGGEIFTFLFSYQAAGLNTVQATLNDATGTQISNFNFNVSNTDRSPSWGAASLTMTANRTNTVSLNGYCTDPDPGSVLSYLLISGPAGLVVLPGGTLSWSPVQTASGGQLGDFDVKIECTDDDIQRRSAVGTVRIHVDADHLPTFTTAPTTWALTEGAGGSIIVEAADADGDPLKLQVVDTSMIKSGFPVGAGVFTVTTLSSGPTWRWQVDFTPSYLQTLFTATGSTPVRLMVNYDSAAGYDSNSSKVYSSLQLDVTNADDPPQWVVQPEDQDVTEGSAFSFTGAAAVDNPPGTTTITYGVAIVYGDHCDWINVDPSTAEVYGTPDLTSSRRCVFQLTATDQHSLMTSSSTFTYTVANTNQPVTVRSDAITQVSTQERQALSVLMTDIFDDPDLTAGDSYESLTYQCLNCAALGITDLAFGSNTLSWTPLNGVYVNSPYDIQIQATDIGGVMVTAPLRIVVTQGPAPMVVTPSDTALVLNETFTSPPASTALGLTVAPASGSAVDGYPYIVSATCTKTTGGACRDGLLVSPTVLSGDGTGGSVEFQFSLQPNGTDGDAALPDSSQNYVLNFKIQKADDPLLYTEVSVSLQVSNVNRPPTQVGISSVVTVGTPGSPYTWGTGNFTLLPKINASQDTKSGSTWSKTYKVAFDLLDDDGSIDTKSFRLVESLAPGSVSGNIWSFKLPSCVNAGTTTVTRTYTVEGSDGRGGTVTRKVILTLQNVQSPSASCL